MTELEWMVGSSHCFLLVQFTAIDLCFYLSHPVELMMLLLLLPKYPHNPIDFFFVINGITDDGSSSSLTLHHRTHWYALTREYHLEQLLLLLLIQGGFK